MTDQSFSVDRSQPDAPSRLNRWLAAALVISALVLLGWLGWRAARTGLYARAALDDLDRLQGILAKPSMASLAQAQADLTALQLHMTEASAAGSPFLHMAPAFGWAPRFGSDLVAAPQLVEMAVALADTGKIASDALAPIAGLVGGGAGGLDALPQVVDTLVAAQPALAEASARLARAEELRAQLPRLTEPRLARQLEKLDQLLPLAKSGLALAQAAPSLLGADGPRTYLLLAQNNDELRATGGFISGAGHVTLDHGKITDLTLKDSYAVDNWDQPHPEPPAALRKYMATDLWVLRDTNWYPDFPTSADVARAIYAQDQGVNTDGAIALDLEAVRALVGAVGPLQVAGVDEPVTGDNALQWMKAAWQSPVGAAASLDQGGAGDAWWSKRKDFMGELVKAALAKVQAGGDLDLLGLARALYSSLDSRHLQVAVDDPTAAAVLAERGWDGGVRAPDAGDFLLVVDSNLGFNKVNLVVREALDYTVTEVEGGLEATLQIDYTHGGPADAEPVCDRAPRYGATYEDMAARCYWDYLRVYAPADSVMVSSEGLESAETEPGERGTTAFAGDFVLKPGETHRVVLRYLLPETVSAKPYSLYARKQAGTPAWPLKITHGDCSAQTTLVTDYGFDCPATGAPQ